jgi:hypothetical protein
MIVANPRPLPSASNRSRPLPPRKCHPERSEGSAFRFSSLCALCISAFSSPNVDALDAASSISPLSVTLTKNTRGGGGGTSQASAKNTNPDPSLFDFRLLGLFTLRSEGGVVEGSSFNSSSSNSFTIRTYPKPARNPFAMSTSKTKDLKSFRIRTYEKKGRGGPSHQALAADSFYSLPTTHYSLLTSSPLKPLPQMAHPYTCTCKKGPAAREPRYSPCAAS